MSLNDMEKIEYKENIPIDIELLTALYRSVSWTAHTRKSVAIVVERRAQKIRKRGA